MRTVSARSRTAGARRALAALLCAGAALAAGAAAHAAAASPSPPVTSTDLRPGARVASPGAHATPRYTLEELVAMSRAQGRLLAAARAGTLAARAGVQGARAYPNPRVELYGNDARARRAGALPGAGSEIALSQPIENPALRSARVSAAEASVATAEAAYASTEVQLVAEVRRRFYDTLRAAQALEATRDDLALTEQVAERVRARVEAGESARFDLVRARTELEVARSALAEAGASLAQARALLRRAVAPALPERFTLAGEVQPILDAGALASLRDAVLERNPSLRVANAEARRRARRVDVERGLVLPSVAIELRELRSPELRTVQAGIALSVPLANRREGPILAAEQLAQRARLDAERARFELAQDFEAAASAYEASVSKLRSLEGGIVESARSAVAIAEAAYRLGERGILELLDARRTYRAVRRELIVARYGVQDARIELERLAGVGVTVFDH